MQNITARNLIAPTVLVLVVIYAVPFLIYGAASALSGLQPPTDASPALFLLGVLFTKVGTAALFVFLFAATAEYWKSRWRLYALAWFVMFVLSEIGDAVSGRSTPLMAALGVISEAIYLPLSSLLVNRLARPWGTR